MIKLWKHARTDIARSFMSRPAGLNETDLDR